MRKKVVKMLIFRRFVEVVIEVGDGYFVKMCIDLVVVSEFGFFGLVCEWKRCIRFFEYISVL